MAKESQSSPDAEFMRLIVEEVDEARETMELVSQLAPRLPIKSAKELVGEGVIRFRGEDYDVKNFAAMVPAFVFPIDSKEKLVQLAAMAARMAPPQVEFDHDDPETAKRLMLRILSSRSGAVGTMRAPFMQSGQGMGPGAPRHRPETTQNEEG